MSSQYNMLQYIITFHKYQRHALYYGIDDTIHIVIVIVFTLTILSSYIYAYVNGSTTCYL